MIEARERPIIFSGPSVIAIQQDRKTQTRRVIRKPETYTKIRDCAYCCTCGDPGDRLWVRETWDFGLYGDVSKGPFVVYRADEEMCGTSWRSSMFMPRKYSRLLLEIADVRVQRVQEIDEADAQRAGVPMAAGSSSHDADQDMVLRRDGKRWFLCDAYKLRRAYPEAFAAPAVERKEDGG